MTSADRLKRSQEDEGIPPLIVIVGETASGKSDLAISLAERFNGEVICADSRTVYRGMDIGTAKPTPEDRKRVPHHLLDVVSPDEQFTVADFKRLAVEAIDEISGRQKLPILVGGSGLYVDAVIYDFEFLPKADEEQREMLSRLSVEELQRLVRERGLSMPKNDRNPRHLIRVLETGGKQASRGQLRENTLILGLCLSRDALKERIVHRVERMVEQGLVDEVRSLVEQYGEGARALEAPGYKALKEYLAGRTSLEEAQRLFIKNDLSLAKRQRTWFRRNKSIHYIGSLEDAVGIVTTFLNKYQG